MTKKLIEVSLPLEAINVASAREKSIRHGHPSTLHLWWARRPLAACRAVLFSSLVDDPSEYMPDEESAHVERERLFGIIEKLVIWENSNDEDVLYEAQLEIARSVARNLNVDVPIGKEAVREFLATKAPPVLDPFAGGGSIPLEAQRLGLRAYASDLNPVAVLINKALIEIPPKFANMPPVHPVDEAPDKKGKGKKGEATMSLWQKEWKGAQGLAEDVRYYGNWMRNEAIKRIGHLYPPVTITKEILTERPDLIKQGLKIGDQLTVIAWLWARTVKCPNPACGAEMPLVKSFAISTKKGKEAWVEYIVEQKDKPPKIQFRTHMGVSNQPGTVNRNGSFCLACNTPVSFEYIRKEGQTKKIHKKLLAIVCEGDGRRVFLSPQHDHENIITTINNYWKPESELSGKAAVNVALYGIKTHGDLFTERQLLLLSTFCDLLVDVHKTIISDNEGESNKKHEYANAVVTYLALLIDQVANHQTTICTWNSPNTQMRSTFARQALPMTWDYAESNPFCESSGSFHNLFERLIKGFDALPAIGYGNVSQVDATKTNLPIKSVFSTDPPYYDNIGYADLSDFFYVWLRKSLSHIYSDIFQTLLVPKKDELVATPYRFDGNKDVARKFFEDGLGKTFEAIHKNAATDFPVTVFYAFKQTETEEEFSDDLDDSNISATSSTGWETMLASLIFSGFQINGTWPMRTEKEGRSIGIGANALASSIVLVCRPIPNNAPSASRREFLSALKKELAPALRELQQGSIAPVDLAQASIGPGMAVFSRYSAVLEADGKPMSVRTALTLINQALDEFLAEQEGEYDGDTRWALSWFEQFGHNEGQFGIADVLSRAKNTSVDGLSEAGIVEARGGKVRLYRREELDTDWDPATDKRLTAWESAAHLIYALENNGEEAAAELLAKLGSVAEVARDLAYRLYTVCERKGWAQDALGYNMLVVAWPRLKELAAQKPQAGQGQLI